VADLRACRIEIGDVCALVVAGDLERAARASGRLLEDQADLLAVEVLLLRAGILGAFEVACQIQQVADLGL
jgi:hypothetical protein